MNSNETVNYISSVIGNPNLAESIYVSINTALTNPLILLDYKSSIQNVFNRILDNSIRDIENHPRGELFKRLIEYGPLNPDESDLFAYPQETVLSDAECISAVNFIYAHIINRFKGDLAELLAIKPCLKLFEELKMQNKIPQESQLCFGDYIKEYQSNDKMAKGADGLIVQNISKSNSVSILGVIEIKSMYFSNNKLLSQINKHISRLSKGAELGGKLYTSKQVHFNSDDLIKIMVIPNSLPIDNKFIWLEGNKGYDTIISDKITPEVKYEEVDNSVWKITLDWSKEEIEQAAYEMTFNYMAEIGKVVYKDKPVPKEWKEMSPAEAGYNSIKEKLYYIMLRPLTKKQDLRAIKLYNVYSFGYPSAIESKEMLWPEDIYQN